MATTVGTLMLRELISTALLTVVLTSACTRAPSPDTAMPAAAAAPATTATAPPTTTAASPTTAATETPTAPAQPEAATSPAAPTATAAQPVIGAAAVPQSQAALPPFPFFDAPEGLKSGYGSDRERNLGLDGQYFIDGQTPVLIEGRVFRDKFALTHGDRTYTQLEFLRNYENAITALGGQRIDRKQWNFTAQSAVDGNTTGIAKYNHGAPATPDHEHWSYLIRSADNEYWIDVSAYAFSDPNGYVVVVERKGLATSVPLLDAAAMRQALDEEGRVALYINFDTDKATLRPDAQPAIDEINKLMTTDAELKLSIEGHTDNTGKPDHNLELSTARARSVLGALVGLGIDPARLTSSGHGQDKPIADNSNDDGRAKNRRVELVKR